MVAMMMMARVDMMMAAAVLIDGGEDGDGRRSRVMERVIDGREGERRAQMMGSIKEGHHACLARR